MHDIILDINLRHSAREYAYVQIRVIPTGLLTYVGVRHKYFTRRLNPIDNCGYVTQFYKHKARLISGHADTLTPQTVVIAIILLPIDHR
jgi:hypothetical protein